MLIPEPINLNNRVNAIRIRQTLPTQQTFSAFMARRHPNEAVSNKNYLSVFASKQKSDKIEINLN